MENTANHIILRGSLAGLPEFSHENHDRRFYRFALEVARLSGAVDVLQIVVGEDILHRFNRLFLTDLTFVLYDRHCRQGNKKKCKI